MSVHIVWEFLAIYLTIVFRWLSAHVWEVVAAWIAIGTFGWPRIKTIWSKRQHIRRQIRDLLRICHDFLLSFIGREYGDACQTRKRQRGQCKMANLTARISKLESPTDEEREEMMSGAIRALGNVVVLMCYGLGLWALTSLSTETAIFRVVNGIVNALKHSDGYSGSKLNSNITVTVFVMFVATVGAGSVPVIGP